MGLRRRTRTDRRWAGGGSGMKIEISEGDREWVVRQAVELLLHGDGGDDQGLQREIRRQVEAGIAKLTTRAFEEAVQRQVGERIQAILDAGWKQTNHYGEPTGTTVTVRELILEKLNTPVGDRYNGGTKPLVKHLVDEAVNQALRQQLGKELARAQEEIRAAVDGLIKEKLAETLRSALGLR